MHMLSKKSSAELETLGRSRNSITMVTANGEVQTSEEAQVDVHDLHLFMTVQILEDTLAVLSSGKLCDEHGYTNEWASGKQPRLTKQGKNIFLQDGKCCTYGRSWVIEFIFYIATTGLVKYIDKYIIKSSFGAK